MWNTSLLPHHIYTIRLFHCIHFYGFAELCYDFNLHLSDTSYNLSPLPLLVNHLGIFSYKGPLPCSLLLFYWVVCFYKLLSRNSLNIIVMTPFLDIYIYIYRERVFFFHYVACLCTVLMILLSNRSSNLNVIDIFPI